MLWRRLSVSNRNLNTLPNAERHWEDSLWGSVRSVVQNKAFLLWTILLVAGGYGFRLTHPVVGLDDLVIDLYFVMGRGPYIGRWPFYLLHKIFPIGYYTPFLMDFAGVCLLILSGILWVALLEWLMGRKLPTAGSVLFCAILINYAMNAEVFVYYLHNGVCISSCLMPIAIYWTLRYGVNASMKTAAFWKGSLGAMSLVMLAIGFYESFAAVYLMGLCMVLLADIFSENRFGANRWKKLFPIAVYGCVLVAAAMVVRTLIGKGLCAILDVEMFATQGMRSAGGISWLFSPDMPKTLVEILKGLVFEYGIVGLSSWTGVALLAAMAVLMVVTIYQGIRRKESALPLLALAMVIFSFLISFFMGEPQAQRSCQTFPLLIAGVALAVYLWAQKRGKVTRWILAAAAVLAVGNITLEINNEFAANYDIRMREYETIDRIAEDLEEDYPVEEKPVLFVGTLPEEKPTDPRLYVHPQWLNNITTAIKEESDTQNVGSVTWSITTWAGRAFWNYYGANGMIPQLFALRGHELIRGTQEQYLEAEALAEAMPQYPKRGYIQEEEDFIIVHLSDFIDERIYWYFPQQ